MPSFYLGNQQPLEMAPLEDGFQSRLTEHIRTTPTLSLCTSPQSGQSNHENIQQRLSPSPERHQLTWEDLDGAEDNFQVRLAEDYILDLWAAVEEELIPEAIGNLPDHIFQCRFKFQTQNKLI